MRNPNVEEVARSLEKAMEALVRDLPIEVRLRGIKAEERLQGLSPEEMVRLRRLLDEKLAGSPHSAKGRRPRRK